MNKPDDAGDVPVLTQIVEDEHAAPPPAVDSAALEKLAHELESAVLERLGPEIDRVTALALDGVRAQLSASVAQGVREAVREAVTNSVSHALALPKRD